MSFGRGARAGLTGSGWGLGWLRVGLSKLLVLVG